MAELAEDTTSTSYAVIGAAIEVHRCLGPGLLESVYEQCLCRELALRQIPFQCQVPMPVEYKGVKLDCSYRIDLLVKDEMIAELKAVDALTDVYRAQLLTYLRLTHKRIGLLINFNVPYLKDGIERLMLSLFFPLLSLWPLCLRG